MRALICPLFYSLMEDNPMAKELTDAQKDELIAQYSQLILDSMDYKSLEQFVYNTLIEDFDKLTDSELKDEIECTFDEETLEELVDNVTSETITQGGQS